MASGSMNTTEKLPYTLAPADASGTAREVENFEVDLQGADLTWEQTDANNGFIVSGSTTGTFDVIFRADARLGDGETIITETHQVTVTSPEATALTGTFGAPVPK